jgi:alkanesulfonate monooxygenase SsuD/methylene tetrahydromethanopterin reductase-like flavin-dependent oxidoreductase (luciferase family)
VTSLDVISGGRALLGVGTGWFEEEHTAFGFHFGTLKERFDRFGEALAILVPMLRDERPTFSGEHYTVKDLINRPAAIQPGGIPIMIGGAGEKKTLRLVAEHADESNLPCPLDEVPQKLVALERHCEAVGRDRDSITVTVLFSLIVGQTTAEAEAARDRLLASRGLDGLVVNLPANGHEPGAIALAGEVLGKALGS